MIFEIQRGNLIRTLNELQNPLKRNNLVNNKDLNEDFDYLDTFSIRSKILNQLNTALLTIITTSTKVNVLFRKFNNKNKIHKCI